MVAHLSSRLFLHSSFRVLLLINLAVVLIIILQNTTLKIKIIDLQITNVSDIKNNFTHTTLLTSLTKSNLSSIYSWFDHHNKTLETTIQCIGSLYNQSCLYKNLYYVDSSFMILTVKGRYLPPYSVRTDAFSLWDSTPNKREFNTYTDLENFVRYAIHPKVFSSVTLHFGQPWHHNVGHALFDGLYPAYVALIRFSPRHLLPFRILAGVTVDCNDCWSEDVYSRFGGIGIIKENVLKKMSNGRWFMFDELVMGSGTFCQRCTQPNLQLAGGVELDASRLFRDRMYQQHGLIPPVVRHKSSSEGRISYDILLAYIIDNKRFTENDRKEINNAINIINSYTYSNFNETKLEWPLIYVTYLYYGQVKAENLSFAQINATSIDSRSPTYELIDNKFIAQLKIMHQSDIHIVGPGTGQMYQTFLRDGSVNINLGGIRPWGKQNTHEAYTSYLEQYMTSGASYIKGLYYPINERTKGIKKEEVIKLIRHAGQLIFEGFSLPVNPRDNLAPDGQLFVEMCEKDKEFCSLVTTRTADKNFSCLEFWVEDFVHESAQWKLGGYIDNNQTVSCSFNRTLLHELRNKYGIKHNNSMH